MRDALGHPEPAKPALPEPAPEEPAKVYDHGGDPIVLWTDGACSGNPGPGGSAWVGTDPAENHLFEGSCFIGKDVTNNAAEIMAAVHGLNALKEGATVTLITDSQYVVGTMNENWRRKKNIPLWYQLDAAVERHASVTFRHVRGHNGNRWNEHVDTLAVAAREAGA